MQVLLLFAYCFLSWSNSFVAAWLAWATSLHLHSNTHLEVECPDGNDWKPSQTLLGMDFFSPPLFLHFAFPPTKPNTLHSSCHHAKCLPFDGISTLELGRVAVCIGCDFCEFQVKPMLQLTRGQFCSISTLGMGPHCLSVAVSTWLVATCLSHKGTRRFKHVLWCVYLQFGGRRVFGMNCCTYRI